MIEEKTQREDVVPGLNKKKMDRKEFLKLSALAGTAVALSHIPRAVAEISPKNKSKHRYAMVIDLARCIGCEACSVACKVEHNVPPRLRQDTARRIQWTEVSYHQRGGFPYVKTDLNPRPCFHCENPPCVRVCPTGATYRDEERGLVLQHYERCIGCRYCALACPYSARYFNWKKPAWQSKEREQALNPDPHPGVKKRIKGIIEKCTFCVERLDRLEAKAEKEGRSLTDEELHRVCTCVNTCMGRARHFGDLNDPESTVSKLARSGRAFRLLEDLGTEPKVYYLKEA